jgi:hypothetical protein
MSLYDDYRNTDYLDDVSFIGGTEFILYFPIYDADTGNLMTINSSTATWVLGLYGNPEISPAVLQKTATIYDSHTFAVTLTENDTINLGSDIYIQQLRITDSAGKKNRPAQGIVIIRKAIPIA